MGARRRQEETPAAPKPLVSPRAVAARGRPAPRDPPGSRQAGELYRGRQGWAGPHLCTLITAVQAGPWLGSRLARKSVPERART